MLKGVNELDPEGSRHGPSVSQEALFVEYRDLSPIFTLTPSSPLSQNEDGFYTSLSESDIMLSPRHCSNIYARII